MNIYSTLKDGFLTAVFLGATFSLGSFLVNQSIDNLLTSFLIGFGFGLVHSILEDVIHSSTFIARLFYGVLFGLLVLALSWAYISNFSEMKTVLKIVIPFGMLMLFGIVATMFYAYQAAPDDDKEKDR